MGHVSYTLAYDGNASLRNVGNHLSSDAASHPRRSKASSGSPNHIFLLFKIEIKDFSSPLYLQYLFLLLTYSIEKSPSWETNRLSAGQEIPCIFGTRRFIAAFINDGHIFLPWAISIQSMPPSHFLKIHLNIILPPRPGSSKWDHSLRFLHQNPVCICPHSHTCNVPRQSHSSWRGHPNNIWWGYRSISSSLWSLSTPLLPHPS